MKMPKMKMRMSDRWSGAVEEMAERAETGREVLAERAEASREALAERAAQIREQFAESYDPDAAATFAAWTLVSTGLALGATAFVRGKRRPASYILPVVLGITGAMMLSGRGMWQRRKVSIGEAEARVRSELSALDPVARFQVLRDVAGETVPFVRHIDLRRN